MTLEQWALPKLSEILPFDEDSLKEIIRYTSTLPDAEAAEHLRSLLGETEKSEEFIVSFNEHRSNPPPDMSMSKSNGFSDSKTEKAEKLPPPQANHPPIHSKCDQELPPSYAPPSYAPPSRSVQRRRPHTNPVIEAANIRARDEVCVLSCGSWRLTNRLKQQMQMMLQNLQNQYGIYNSEIEPEHEVEYYCSCAIHRYKQMKYNRYGVQVNRHMTTSSCSMANLMKGYVVSSSYVSR